MPEQSLLPLKVTKPNSITNSLEFYLPFFRGILAYLSFRSSVINMTYLTRISLRVTNAKI